MLNKLVKYCSVIVKRNEGWWMVDGGWRVENGGWRIVDSDWL